MISLFSKLKTPNYDKYDHYLHGKIVAEYEEKFADYVGAKYACAANSETSLIFLIYNKLNTVINLPSICPPVVANAIINGGNKINLVDNVDWIGNDYPLDEYILDSAQKIEKNQYKNSKYSIILYSNYPTKPVAGIDGGVLVSDNKIIVDYFRKMIYNGMNTSTNSWDRNQTLIGWKMYMNTIQAEVALNSLNNLEIKKEKLGKIREKYNNVFSLLNTSDHLYRVKVDNNIKVLEKLKEKDIMCGIHYKPLHTLSLFNPYRTDIGKVFPLSDIAGNTMLSIPFHEDLSNSEIDKVVNEVSSYVI
jgi:dTDP-4-amino-4,6-dideoxygalactose transaminase